MQRQGLTRQARKVRYGWGCWHGRATLGATAVPTAPRTEPRTCPESPAAALQKTKKTALSQQPGRHHQVLAAGRVQVKTFARFDAKLARLHHGDQQRTGRVLGAAIASVQHLQNA